MDPTIVIVGAGHNGLTAAFYLARAGLQPIVLEARDVVGGGAVTEEIAPGYRCATLAHTIGPLRASIVSDMQLERRGVEFVRPDPRVIALAPDGVALPLSADVGRTAVAIDKLSGSDAAKYPEFCAVLARLGAFLAPLMEATPPSMTDPVAGDLWDLLKTGRRFRRLGRADLFRLLRWMPMAVADLVGEWFSTDLLQAMIAARGIAGAAMGPWSGGTGAVLLFNAAVDPAPGGSSISVRGGPGVLSAAMADAAREAGAEIRTGSPVTRVLVRDGRAAGVRLDNGREVPARAVVSSVDPKRTLLGLVDPGDLQPVFSTKIRNFRCRGVVAKVNLALSALPAFRGVTSPADLAARLHIGPSIDYLERAFDASKYGNISPAPYLDVTIPSLHDPSLAPPGHHVMSVCMQYAPFKLSAGLSWEGQRTTLARVVMDTLEQYAPGIQRLVVQQHAITPADLEDRYGFTAGDVLHGEPSLDQLYAMRPILGWAQYRTPVDGLFLCGAGTHPGGGITGGPGQNAAREIVKSLR